MFNVLATGNVALATAPEAGNFWTNLIESI